MFHRVLCLSKQNLKLGEVDSIFIIIIILKKGSVFNLQVIVPHIEFMVVYCLPRLLFSN